MKGHRRGEGSTTDHLCRVRRVWFFNFGSGRVRVVKKYFGLGRVGSRVFVSNTKSIGYYGVLKSWSGIRRVSPLFPILSNIYYLIWLIWSIKHVFGRHIYVIVVQCGRSWQPFGDRRKSHKPSYRTRVPFCCFGMTRNVKRGPESTIWMVDPSGRSTYLLMWMCWLAVPFVVSAPFDDKICWYGQVFRINILCNRPILLMDEQLMLGLQNQHSVQLTHFVDGTDNVAEWKF